MFTQANVMLVFAVAFFGSGLLLPSYFQQVLHQTPMESGVHMVPQGLGAMLTMPLAGAFMDKRGPGKSVLIGISLIAAGLGTFAFGAARQVLAPHQIARGSTLLSVNQQVGGSIGTAMMSVLLTNQFNRSEYISAANKVALLQQDAARSGAPVDPAAIPRPALAPDFASNLLRDLSHSYTTVFVVAVTLMVSTIIPAAFLPKKPAS